MLCFTLTLNAQVFTITTQEGNSVIKIGNVTDYKEVLRHPDGASMTEVLNAKYVIDLKNKTSTFYDNGKLVSVLPFNSISFVDSVYTINLVDYLLVDPSVKFKTTMVLNIKKDQESLIWFYYNQIRDFTLVQRLTKYQIKKSPK